MSEQTTAPVEAVDPFNGENPSFEEYSTYRKTGEMPARFKLPEAEPSEAEKSAKTAEGQEPSTSEQETKGNDEKGKLKAGEKEPLFNEDQQKAFDKAFAKREAKLRREFESRQATNSSTQVTAPDKQPTPVDATEPQRPEPPKLSEYKGTVAEYEQELKEYPAKLQAFLDAQRQHQERITSVQDKLAKSEKGALKAHPDYKEEFDALAEDIRNNEEPKLPQHVLKAIAEESEDPHELTYYLAKNREEFRRLAELGPMQALREILRLDVKLEAAKGNPAPDPKKKPTQAPKPVETVSQRATSTAFDANDDKMPADEWTKQRNMQVNARRGR